ncbi:hypothetical protein [Streptomyces pseudogriseolus]|uniref:hypothetical protein n=1 Tax=Streptomyces pseudogriseolus TaxID=36817 RepID=UPI003FA256CC
MHLGSAATDMTSDYDGPELTASEVIGITLDGLADGAVELLADEWSRTTKAGLAQDPAEFYAAAVRPVQKRTAFAAEGQEGGTRVRVRRDGVGPGPDRTRAGR